MNLRKPQDTQSFIGVREFTLNLVWLFLFLMMSQPSLADVLPFSVTPEEQSWLDSMQGRALRVAPAPAHPPYASFDAKGEFVGIFADFLQLFQEQLGLEVEVHHVQGISDIFAGIKSKEYDLIPGMVITPEREEFLHFSDPIVILSYALIVQANDSSIQVESDLAGKRVAFFHEQQGEIILLKKYPTIIPVYVNTGSELVQAVANNQADATILVHGTAMYLASHLALAELKTVAILDWEVLRGAFAIRDDYPELVSLLNKCLAALPETKKSAIFAKWSVLQDGVKPHTHFKLTVEEQAWLAQHPVIRVGADSAWRPIEYFEDGEYKGLAIDNLKHVEQILGVRFEFIHEDWQTLIALAKQKDVDLFSGVVQTPERDNYLLFTDPYVRMPSGIFTRKDVGYFSDVKFLMGKKVAVVEGYAIHDYLLATYPDLDVVVYRTPLLGIRAVQDEDVFAFIGNTVTTGYYIRLHSFAGLKMAGEISFVNAVGLGVRKDWGLFHTILQKALDATPDAKRNAMYNQWVPMVYQNPVNYRNLWQMGAVVLLFILVVLIWNRRLAVEIAKRTASLDKINVRYREAQVIAQLGHWELDLKTKVLQWSAEVYKIFELKPEDFGASYAAFLHGIHPDDRDRVRKAYEDSLHNKTEYALTHRLLMDDGRIKFVHERCRTDYDETGQPLRSLGTVQDVSESMQAEESRLQLLTAIEQAFESFVITDSKACIQYVNPAFERLTGYTKAEVLGQNPQILNSGKQPSLFYQKMWQTLGRGEVWTGHFINKKKDGSLFEEDATITPVVDEHGVVVSYIAVKRDVTQQVIIEQQLRQAMKMEAIGTLAGGIAHDFNNILGAILGYSEMVRAALPTDGQLRKDMDHVIRAGNRATDLVKQILTFSRQGEEEFRPIKIQLVIKEALKLLRSSLPSTIKLEQQIDSDTGLILADPTQVHQVLMNICTNAKHAMGGGSGTLTVILSEKYIADIHHLEAGLYLDLEIGDTGCGMAEGTLAKIFDPFFTTKEKGKGTGLGLAVVHGIVKQHEGDIVVHSRLGEGTTFHIYLPVVDEIQVAPPIAPPAEMPRGSGRILFVDDEIMIVRLMERILVNLGYTVTGVESSAEALAVYVENPQFFDLVITDMTMPEMTGALLSQKILAIRPSQPIILCTGFSEVIDEQTTMKLGVAGFLKKPVDKLLLAQTIRDVLLPLDNDVN